MVLEKNIPQILKYQWWWIPLVERDHQTEPKETNPRRTVQGWPWKKQQVPLRCRKIPPHFNSSETWSLCSCHDGSSRLPWWKREVPKKIPMESAFVCFFCWSAPWSKESASDFMGIPESPWKQRNRWVFFYFVCCSGWLFWVSTVSISNYKEGHVFGSWQIDINWIASSVLPHWRQAFWAKKVEGKKEKLMQHHHQFSTSWWLNQPIWKICSSNWIISNLDEKDEHKKYLKPPPRPGSFPTSLPCKSVGKNPSHILFIQFYLCLQMFGGWKKSKHLSSKWWFSWFFNSHGIIQSVQKSQTKQPKTPFF